ncbi:hypothetical protein Tco_0547414, partial [Tanacetum coccineum]
MNRYCCRHLLEILSCYSGTCYLLGYWSGLRIALTASFAADSS